MNHGFLQDLTVVLTHGLQNRRVAVVMSKPPKLAELRQSLADLVGNQAGERRTEI